MLVVKIGHQKRICYSEIGLWAQNRIANSKQILEGLCDHFDHL